MTDDTLRAALDDVGYTDPAVVEPILRAYARRAALAASPAPEPTGAEPRDVIYNQRNHYIAGCSCPLRPLCVPHGWSGTDDRTEQVICADHDHDAAPEPTGLDAAWAEAEAAVNATGRSFLRLTHNTYDRDGKHYDYYYAACNWVPGELAEDGSGPTPAAALRALAARLKEPTE